MNTITLSQPPRRPTADIHALRRAIGWLPTSPEVDLLSPPDDVPPAFPATIATPAQRLVCAFSDWAPSEMKPVSPRGQALRSHGYKMYCRRFGNDGHVAIVLRASASATVELQTLIAYPDRRGYGSVVMRELCRLADELGVDLWLDALPYGNDRVPMPLRRLKVFYRRFGFFPVAASRLEWISGYHRWDGTGSTDLMMRRHNEADKGEARSVVDLNLVNTTFRVD